MAIHRCSECQAFFTQARGLRRLRCLHRFHHCQYCPVNFAKKSELEQHFLLHNQTFITQTNLGSNLDCWLLTPTQHRCTPPAMQQYRKSAASRQGLFILQHTFNLFQDFNKDKPVPNCKLSVPLKKCQSVKQVRKWRFSGPPLHLRVALL